jgi:hypothetical protein
MVFISHYARSFPLDLIIISAFCPKTLAVKSVYIFSPANANTINYMKELIKKYAKIIKLSAGAFCGLLNGLFGSGGGVVAVPMLRFFGLEARKSHATSVAVIFFLSIASVIAYGIRGSLDWQTALTYIPWGIAGAVLGALLLRKIPNSLLRRIFGLIVLISAVRILFL